MLVITLYNVASKEQGLGVCWLVCVGCISDVSGHLDAVFGFGDFPCSGECGVFWVYVGVPWCIFKDVGAASVRLDVPECAGAHCGGLG